MLDDPLHEKELARLVVLFSEIEYGIWTFGLVTSPAYRLRVRQELALRTGLQILDHVLAPSREDPLIYLDELPPAARDQRLIVSFTGLEQAMPELFGYFDYQREAYTQHPHCLIFWLTEETLRQVQRRAPNFYSRHNGVYDFRTAGVETAPARAGAAAQAQIELLQKKLQALDLLREELGDAVVDRQIAALTQQQLAVVQGGDNALAQGPNAKAAAGGSVVADAIHGNVVIVHNDWRDYVSDIYEDAPLSKVPLDLLRAAYLRAVANDCRRLPLGIVEPKLVKTGGERQIVLPDIYVDLDVTTPQLDERQDEQRLALRLARGEGERRTPLLDAIAAPAGRAVVLLGDAGSGKSTFVNYLTLLLTGDSAATPKALRGLLPVRLLLREVAAGAAPERAPIEWLWDALKSSIRRFLGQDAADRLFGHLQRRLLRDGGLFLLDGLDEAPEAGARRQQILAAVRDLQALLPETARLLITARPYAYADPQWRLANFQVLTLAPFAEKQLERFTTRWYEAAAPTLGLSPDEATRRAGSFRQALRQRSYLADLASRPLLLTLMATVHSSWGQLPEDRADLYEEAVELLLYRWQQAKQVTGPDGQPLLEPGLAQLLRIEPGELRSALQNLAYAVHRRQQTTRGDDAADISEGEVLVAFKPLLGRVDADTALRYPQERAGLLLARRPGFYAFPHRSFQEYLAACHLADQAGAIEQIVRLVEEDPTWWREVTILFAGKKKRGGLDAALPVVEALAPDSPEDAPQPAPSCWPNARIAGQTLLELRVSESVRAERRYQGVQRRVQKWLLAALRADTQAPPARAEAGRTLARLGDPRREVMTSAGMEFCYVPAGRFWMGSSKNDRGAYEDERPQHQLNIPYDYWIGRYPVTNAQFDVFVQAQGYAKRDYWPEAMQAGYWTPDGFKGRWDDAWRQQPYDHGEPYRLPNHPVVGVSWYEAMAYTRWLTEVGQAWLPEGWRVQLPSEPEWEKAARGGEGLPARPIVRPLCDLRAATLDPGPSTLDPAPSALDLRRRYPWGDDPDPNRANCQESGIGAASAVGCFGGGASRYGAEEMSGNVWEWTRSLWGEYPYPAAAADRRQREDLEQAASKGCVIRGGSYFVDIMRVGCARRDGYFPNY